MIIECDSIRRYKVYSVLFILLFSPSFFYVALNASSMAVGVFFTTIYLLIVVQKKLPLLRVGAFPSLVLLVMFFLHFIVGLTTDFEGFSIKYLISFILIFFLLLCAAFLSLEIRKLNGFDFFFIFKSLSLLILFIGVIPLFWKFDILGYERYSKSIFPFAEPSHYAISVGSFLFTTGLFLSTPMKICLVVTVCLLGMFYPSLILLVVALIMVSLYSIKSTKNIFLLITSVSLIFLYLINFTDSLSYFIARLDFSQTTQNLTALVYLQGWQDMHIALYESNGFGLGFQKMGTLPPGEYGKLIYQLAGEYKNRGDGGFLVSKIIGEFGVFGGVLVAAYLYKFVNSLTCIVRHIKLKTSNKAQRITGYYIATILGHSIIVIFFIEMFGRGYGYFSPGVFLFFVAIFLTSFEKHSLG